MFGRVLKFFDKQSDGDRGADPTHDIRVAACALLLEMAGADGEFSEKERGDIMTLMQKEFQVAPDDAQELMETSQKELDGSIDLWRFTNLINQNYSREEKIGVIETVWRVVYTDGVLDKHEDYLVHKLANLLRLTHKELIDAKVKVLHGS